MLPSEESLKILQMIEQGQISAEEGIRMMNAAASANTAPQHTAAPEHAAAPTHIPEVTIQPVEVPGPVAAKNGSKGWLRVRVTDAATNRNKVTVNLPLGLMAAGMKIGAHFAPELNGLDLTEVLEELRTTQPGKIIDVMDEEDGEHVEIYVE